MELLSQPLISIIIPVFNKARYLRKCLDSIVASNHAGIEIILINDGSNDNSGEICEAYKMQDSRIKVIHQSNSGVSSARNKGINIATGIWIYFIDPDDWIDEEPFTRILSFLQTHSEVDFIRTYCREVDGDVVLNPELPADIQLFTRDEFLQTDFMPGYIHSMFVRRAVIEKNNLRLSLNLDFMEDLEFIFRCVLNSVNILVYNKVFYNYLVNDTSSSVNLNLKKVTDHLWAAIMMKKYSYSYDSLIVKEHLNHQVNNQLYLFFAEMRFVKDKSIIRANKIRAELLFFMRETGMRLNELSKINLILLVMGLIHIRLIFALHRIRASLSS